MLTRIAGGEVYAAQPQGRQSLLRVADRIVSVGEIDVQAPEALRLPLDVIDGSRCPEPKLAKREKRTKSNGRS